MADKVLENADTKYMDMLDGDEEVILESEFFHNHSGFWVEL